MLPGVDPLWGRNPILPGSGQSEPLVAATRPCWDDYWLAGAQWSSTRADCRRRRHGCLLVLANRIVGQGYNGGPPGFPKSCLRGECPRGLQTYKELPGCTSGGGGNHDFSDCISLHAEQNAIGDAAARGNAIRGATSYQTGAPCDGCTKLLMAAGIVRVVTPDLFLTEDDLREMLP